MFEKNRPFIKVDVTENINQKFDKIDAQLADISQEQKKLKEFSVTDKKLYVTLMDDDGRTDFLTKVKPILDEYDVKMTLAINSGLVGTSGFMTWEQLQQLKAEGHEILNHSMGTYGTVADVTLEQLLGYYQQEKDAFTSHGFDTYDYFIYSGTMPWQDADVRNKVSSVYKCCFANSDAPVNYIPFDNFAIHRGSLSYNPIATIDKYLAMGTGYLVLFGHAWMYSDTDLQIVRSAIEYLLSKNVTFVTAKQMVDNFSNIINLGNLGQDKFLLDQNGNVNFSLNGKNINDLTNMFFETQNFSGKPITDYRKNSITVEKVGGTFATWGLPQSGIVKTYRFDDDRFSFQEFSQLGEANLWRRSWDDTNKEWANLGYFYPVSGVSVSTANRPKFIKRGMMIYDYTLNKMIFAQGDGFNLPYVQVARNTAYTLGTYVNTSTDSGITNNRLYECVVAGTTASTSPTYTTTKGDITTDGTAQFKYIGDRVVYRDALGTVVP